MYICKYACIIMLLFIANYYIFTFSQIINNYNYYLNYIFTVNNYIHIYLIKYFLNYFCEKKIVELRLFTITLCANLCNLIISNIIR